MRTKIQKKLNVSNSSNNSINNNKELITIFKDENSKSKRKYNKYKTIFTILKSFDTFVIIATTSSSISLSFTGIGLKAIPISTATACGLSIGNKTIHEINKNSYNNNRKQYLKDQQTIKSFDKLYRKPLQDNVIDKNEYESLCNFFTKILEETTYELLFINMSTNLKLNFFSHTKLKFQPRT